MGDVVVLGTSFVQVAQRKTLREVEPVLKRVFTSDTAPISVQTLYDLSNELGFPLDGILLDGTDGGQVVLSSARRLNLQRALEPHTSLNVIVP